MLQFRSLSIVLACSILAAFAPRAISQEARLDVRIVNADGELTPARAWVNSGGSRLFEPHQPRGVTPYQQDQSFSCDGQFSMRLPPGEATIHVEKGKEFRPVDVVVPVSAGETIEQTVRLERWIDMPSLGWYSADMHLHLGFDNPSVLQQLALADDIHLVPSFTYWLRGAGETWHSQWPDETFAKPTQIDSQHFVTRNNIEIERIARDALPGGTVGATFLFNLNKPVTATRYGEHFPTDAALCREARLESPRAVFDSDKPSWAETVVGAALGELDTIQVCHNHYHRSRTLAGGYGMIGPLAPGESNAAVGDGLFHRTNSLYYRFLNCGFRLGVSGGSAIGVMPVPAGFHRVYAHVEGTLTVDGIWDAIRSGRSFATTGPMLFLTANDQPVGSSLDFDGSESAEVAVQVKVQAIEALESLELIHDGYLVASIDLRDRAPRPTLEADLNHRLSVQRSGWIAARAFYRAPDGLLRQAHTSPIYVSIGGKPTASADDARYMMRWIQHLRRIAETSADHFPDDEARLGVLANYAEAEGRYREILDEAQQHWGD